MAAAATFARTGLRHFQRGVTEVFRHVPDLIPMGMQLRTSATTAQRLSQFHVLPGSNRYFSTSTPTLSSPRTGMDVVSPNTAVQQSYKIASVQPAQRFVSQQEFNLVYADELSQFKSELDRIAADHAVRLFNVGRTDLQAQHAAAEVAQASIGEIIEGLEASHPIALALQPLRDVSVQDFKQALDYTRRIGPEVVMRSILLNRDNFVSQHRLTHHIATREIMTTTTPNGAVRDEMKHRLQQKEAEYKAAGLIASKEIWTDNPYFTRGTLVLVSQGGHIKREGVDAKGKIPVFCTVYSIKNFEALAPIAKQAMIKFSNHQPLSDSEKLNLLLSQDVHPDIKAVVVSDENGSMNHVAFDVKDIHMALDLTHPQIEQNRFQPGRTMDQRSTLAVPTGSRQSSDYVEWVVQKPLSATEALTAIKDQGSAYSSLVLEQHPELESMSPDTIVMASSGFTPGNAQRMFSSTLPGTLKALFDLAEATEWALTDAEKIGLIHTNLIMIDGIKDNPEEMTYYMNALSLQFGLIQT